MTTITDKKQALTLLKDNWSDVDVYFTFSNQLQEDLQVFLLAIEKDRYNKISLPAKFQNADSSTIVQILDKKGLFLKDYPQYQNHDGMVFTAVAQNCDALQYADDSFKSDGNFIRKMMDGTHVGVYSYIFKHVSSELKSDKQLVLDLVSNHKFSSILEYVSEDLKKDKEVVMTALNSERHSIDYISNELKADLKFLKTIKSRYKRDLLRYTSEQWGDNRDFVLEAVKNKDAGYQILFASDRLKKDREIAIEALCSDHLAWTYIKDEFKNDKNYLIEVLPRNPYILANVLPEFKDDKDLVLLAVKTNGYVLEYASDRLKNDREVVLAAIDSEPKSLWMASQAMQENVQVCLGAINKNGVVLEYLPDSMKDNKSVVLAALNSNPAMYEHVSTRLKSDSGILNYIMNNNVNMFKFTPKEFRSDKDNLLDSISKNGLNLRYATFEHKNDPSIVLLAVEQNKEALKYASKEIVDLVGSRPVIKTLELLILNQNLHKNIAQKDMQTNINNKSKL